MNRLTVSKRVQIISLLTEGMSMRAISRVADCSFNSVAKLLEDTGSACLDYQDAALRDLPCKRIQCDELWGFVGMKQKNVPEERKGEFGIGDVWTWTALCADTKLVPCWLVADRGAEAAMEFMTNLAGRLTHRVQLTTDGHNAYLNAVDGVFGIDVDYAMLVKHYGESPEAEKRYSPAICLGATKQAIRGRPEKKHVSTSYVERQNLTMRMSMRRFTRLTNGFSKKVENLAHAVSLHYMHYNFARIHKTLRVTPAMAAGVTDRLWSVRDIVEMAEAAAPKPGKRGPYKPRQPKQAISN
jgi:IS1 family transposase